MPAIFYLKISFTFVAACMVTIFFLISAVGLRRGAMNVLRGDGGDPVLFKRIRTHGNFVEIAPIVALVLITAEMVGVGERWLWTVFALFFIGRIYHWIRYDARDRGVGMGLTTMPSVVLSVAVLYQMWWS